MSHYVFLPAYLLRPVNFQRPVLPTPNLRYRQFKGNFKEQKTYDLTECDVDICNNNCSVKS